MRLSTLLYKCLRLNNDITAVRKHHVQRRLLNKMIGRMTGKLMR